MEYASDYRKNVYGLYPTHSFDLLAYAYTPLLNDINAFTHTMTSRECRQCVFFLNLVVNLNQKYLIFNHTFL